MLKVIELPSDPSSSLQWSSELEIAEQCVAEGKKIFWKLGLGLELPFFPLEDEFRFSSLCLALNQFTKDVWPRFKDATFGLCIYKGAADVAFSWTEKAKENFNSYLQEKKLQDAPESRSFFALDALGMYFQMLSHQLPDEAEIFLLFDLSHFRSISSALSAIGKERFGHFTIATKGMELPRDGYRWNGDTVEWVKMETRTGIVFPSLLENRTDFDRAITGFKEPVKVVFETFLAEEWENLDRLIVPFKNITLQGERMLKGFIAAGGEVLRQGTNH